MKRIAVPVLCALLNLGAGLSPDNTPDTDDDGDDMDFVEYVRRDAPDQGADPFLRTAAITGERIDRAWLHREGNEVTAAVVMRQSDATHGAMEILVENHPSRGEQPARLLLVRALDAVRQTGAVKVTIQSPGLDANLIQTVLAENGMIFSRQRSVDGIPATDAYPDLYWRGDGGKPKPRA